MAASPTVLVVLLLLLFAPSRVAAFDEYVDADGGFLLLDCGHPSSDSRTATTAPPPHSAAGLGSKNVSIADVRKMLGALPAAAASLGFGALSLGAAGGASVRGVCIGDASPDDCRACLAAAARRVTAGCGDLLAGTPRAGTWSDGCFLAYYADVAGAASAPGDDRRSALCRGDFPSSVLDNHRFAVANPRSPDMAVISRLGVKVAKRAAAESARMYAAGNVTAWIRGDPAVHAVAQCARDRTAGECLRCLRASTWQAELSCPALGTGWSQTARVFSYGCYLRFQVTLDPVEGGAAAVAFGGSFLRWIVVTAMGVLVSVM